MIGAALGFAIGVSYFLPAIPVLVDVDAPLVESARTMVGNETLSVMMLAAALTLSERWTRGAASRIAAAAAAIVLVASVMRLGVSPFTSVGWFEMRGPEGARGTGLFAVWHVIAAGILLAVYFDQVRRVQDSARRLQAARMQRHRAEREVLESRLRGIRARVDPVFLFESLAEARRAYDVDREVAEGLLEDLIRFLRASLPASGDRKPALGDEVHLAAAYLKVVSALRGRVFRLEADIPESLSGAFFPPMILLPLIEDAVRRARPAAPREAIIVVRATLEGACARVLVQDAADATLAPPRDLDVCRTTLLAFMGEARVAARVDAGGCTVALEYPVPSPQQARKEVA